MKLKIKNKIFNVKRVTSEEDMQKGLQGVKELPNDEGMLFEFEEPQTVDFWMKDTLIDLDIIFIDEDNEVISVVQGEAGNEEESFEEEDVKYVLEINPGLRIRPGMEVEFLDNEIHVLDSTGGTQAILKGGERIFSRKNTKTLVRMAKKAIESDKDSDYKKVGRKIFNYLDIQNTNEDEYVESPKKEKED